MKTGDEIMKELVQEELEREAAEIRKKITQNPEMCGDGPDPELKRKIWRQAEELQRKKEIYQKLSDADKEALRLGRELQLRREERAKEEIAEELIPERVALAAGAEDFTGERKGKQEQVRKAPGGKRRRKTMFALAAALVAVLGLGITSIGDPGAMVARVNGILGGRQTTNITSESGSTDVTQQEEIGEEKVFQEIKNKFGFDPVRLDYKPQKMKFIDYSLEAEFLTSILYYQYGENIFTYTAAPSYQDFSLGYDIEDPIVEEYTKAVGDVEIQVTEYRIEASGAQEFSAHFEYKDITYILTGIMEKAEFEKILENLHFF